VPAPMSMPEHVSVSPMASICLLSTELSAVNRYFCCQQFFLLSTDLSALHGEKASFAPPCCGSLLRWQIGEGFIALGVKQDSP